MAQELADARKATEEAIAREAATADAVREAEVRGWIRWIEWMGCSFGEVVIPKKSLMW